MARPTHFASLILVAVLLWQAVAGADDKRAQALAHFKRGEAHYQKAEYPQAIEAYQKAYELAPEPLLLFNIAQAHRLQGNLAQAVEHYERYLAADPRGSKAAPVAGYLKELRERDTDHDGVVDLTDTCVAEPEDADGFTHEDGCPDRDDDADGLLDAADKCPREAEDPDGHDDGDGCPDLDDDADGVPDTADRCPTQKGTAANGGCPVVEPPKLPPRRAEPQARPGGTYRALFYASAAVSVVGLGSALFTGLRLKSIEREMQDKIDGHDFGQVRFRNDACAEADNDGYQELSDLCGDQRTMVRATYALIGVGVVGLAASGFFFYKGFLSRVEVTPVVTPDGGGVSALVRF